MDMHSWRRRIIEKFPPLSDEAFEIVGPETKQYNCIAYAAGDTSKRWDHTKGHYWPERATRSDSIASLQEVSASLGFEECHDTKVEAGYRKVALYEKQGKWKHAARQTPSGRWRSKLGDWPVIEHISPESLSGETYGHPTIIMRRPVSEIA